MLKGSACRPLKPKILAIMAITFCLQSLRVFHTHTLRADYLIVIALIEFRAYSFFWTMLSFWYIRC